MNPPFGLERFSNPDFNACAVLCTDCEDQPEMYGLLLVQDYGYLSLYASDEGAEVFPHHRKR